MAAAAAAYYLDLMMSLSSEGQRLSANQISSMYFNPRLRYNNFWFGKTTVRHIEILLPFSILTISPYSAYHCALGSRISSKSVHPRRRYDIIVYRFSWWRPLRRNFTSGFRSKSSNVALFRMSISISKPNVVVITYNSVSGWDIIISAFEIQTSAILEF